MRPRIPHTRRSTEPTNDRSLPPVITVIGASGGAGASTLCALLAHTLSASRVGEESAVAVLDTSTSGLPWLGWSYDDVLLHGLPGVELYTAMEQQPPDGQFVVRIVDQTADPTPAMVERMCRHPDAVLLAIRGSADGIVAAAHAIEHLEARGFPRRHLRPVVIATAPGALPPRVRSRLALLAAGPYPAAVVPFDPSISRRGLTEALDAGAVHKATGLAVHHLLHSLRTHQIPASVRPLSAIAEGIHS